MMLRNLEVMATMHEISQEQFCNILYGLTAFSLTKNLCGALEQNSPHLDIHQKPNTQISRQHLLI